jgi:hypothetical protein
MTKGTSQQTPIEIKGIISDYFKNLYANELEKSKRNEQISRHI